MRRHPESTAFTLVELLAVVVVILLLVAMASQLSGPIQRQIITHRTKAQFAAIANALEMYKGDWGYYPRTLAKRLSGTGDVESYNNAVLYRALFTTGKRYISLPSKQIRTNSQTGLVNIFDEFQMPYVYYNSPLTTNAVYNLTNYQSYTEGWQVNKRTFDLFSFGKNQITYVPGSWDLYPSNNWRRSSYNDVYQNAFDQPGAAVDDITNW